MASRSTEGKAPVKKAPAKKAPAKRTTAPKPVYRVYVLHVRRNHESIRFDYYVGSTKKTLAEKWHEYTTLDEPFLSTKFKSGRATALGFAPELMKGWGPYENEDLAKFAEGELALHLKDLGYAVHSDQLKPARKRRKETGVTFEVPVWNSRAHKKLAKQAGDIRRAAKMERRKSLLPPVNLKAAAN